MDQEIDDLGDDMYLDIFQDSYAALQTHVRTSDGFIVSIHSGCTRDYSAMSVELTL